MPARGRAGHCCPTPTASSEVHAHARTFLRLILLAVTGRPVLSHPAPQREYDLLSLPSSLLKAPRSGQASRSTSSSGSHSAEKTTEIFDGGSQSGEQIAAAPSGAITTTLPPFAPLRSHLFPLLGALPEDHQPHPLTLLPQLTPAQTISEIIESSVTLVHVFLLFRAAVRPNDSHPWRTVPSLMAETSSIPSRQILPPNPFGPSRPLRDPPSPVPPGAIPPPNLSSQDSLAVGAQRRTRSPAGHAGVRDGTDVGRLDSAEDHGHRQDARAGAARGARRGLGRGVYPARGRVLLLCVVRAGVIWATAYCQTRLDGLARARDTIARHRTYIRSRRAAAWAAERRKRDRAECSRTMAADHACGLWSDVDMA